MAIDEAIADAVARGAAPPTLRIYGWRGRWLSIGMAESIGDVDRAAAMERGISLVRRPSGGAAVLHQGHLAWSLTLPATHRLAPADILESYRRQSAIALGICERLSFAARAVTVEEAREPLTDSVLRAACFGSVAPFEIVVGDPPRKLIGWGQVRRRGVVMHHAVLARRFDPIALAAVLAVDRGRLADALAARVSDVRQAAGRVVPLGELVESVAEAHRDAGLELKLGELTAAEARASAVLKSTKYSCADWTSRC